MIAARIDFTTRNIRDSITQIISLDSCLPFDGLEMDASVPGKGTLVVAIQIRLYKGNMLTLDRRFKAADIVAVVVPLPLPAT